MKRERRLMDTKRRETAARMAVARLLTRFFDQLTSGLKMSTGEFWTKVEQRLPRAPMRQQPAQQQQSKAEPEEKG